jgi:hypothetical protein
LSDKTTSIQPSRSANYDLEAVFSGYGIINGTRYTDTGISSIDYSQRGANQKNTSHASEVAGSSPVLDFCLRYLAKSVAVIIPTTSLV